MGHDNFELRDSLHGYILRPNNVDMMVIRRNRVDIIDNVYGISAMQFRSRVYVYINFFFILSDTSITAVNRRFSCFQISVRTPGIPK